MMNMILIRAQGGCEVLSPPELRAEIAEEMRRAAAMYCTASQNVL